jgi:hypothetical protein
VSGEFELRRHEIRGAEKFAALEGSAALGLHRDERFATERAEGAQCLRGRESGFTIASWNLAGFDAIETTEEFAGRRDLNVIYPRMAVNTLRAASAPRVLASLHYASPKPLAWRELRAAAEKIKETA